MSLLNKLLGFSCNPNNLVSIPLLLKTLAKIKTLEPGAVLFSILLPKASATFSII